MRENEPAPSTFSLFSDFAGSRIAESKEIRQACETLDSLECRDLLSLLVFMSQHRLGGVAIKEVIEGNRFHSPSEVSQRDFHAIEDKIFEVLPEVEFIELSPLQPFGTNSLLAGTSIKNVVPSLRRSEVNADATTSLFRESLERFRQDSQKPIRLAANVRTTRAQVFEEGSRFLPHFKMFAEVSIGEQGEIYSEQELLSLIGHLTTEINILKRSIDTGRFRIPEYEVSVGNLQLIQDLIDRGVVDGSAVRQNTTAHNFNVLDDSGISLPKTIPMTTDNIGDVLKDLGFNRGLRITQLFQDLLLKNAPEQAQHISLDLSRIAGIGYYKHICYRIQAKNEDGLWLPLADGGTTTWAEKILQNKAVYTTTSGIGTELLCRYFMTDRNK